MPLNKTALFRYLRQGPFFIQIMALAFLSLLLVAVSINAWQASKGRKTAELWYAHTLDVLLETSHLRADVYSEMRGERGYLLTHNRVFLDPYYAGRTQLRPSVDRVAKLTEDNPVQIRNMVTLRKQLRSYENLLADTVAMEQDRRHEAALNVVRSGVGKHHIDSVLATINRMDEQEKMLLAHRRILVEEAMIRTDLYQYGLSVLGFLLVALAIWMAFGARRAQQVAARLNIELDRLASSDGLTGLANRRAFFSRIERSKVETGPINMGQAGGSAIAILDVDHFKSVNDMYGHPVGDRLLQDIATILRGAVRATDIVGRIGGEEFAIFMPDTSMDNAIQACERARTLVQVHALTLGNGRRVQVSISIGVALRTSGDTVESWITKADVALYRAKESGRNRVQLAA